MNREQAKQILLRHRPGAGPADDPELEAALELSERDPELRAWLAGQGRAQAAIRRAFRETAPPAGLREQIVSEHRAALRAATWRRPQVLVGVALCAVLMAAAWWWAPWSGASADDLTVAAFRLRMVKEALRIYRMEMESNDLEQVRGYLAQRGYPGDFVLPEPVGQAKVTGCLRTRWQNHNVAMICFLRNKSDSTGVPSDLWLFVMDDPKVKDAPAGVQVQYAKVNRLGTMAWTKDGKLYLLGTEGDEAMLRKWL